MKKFAYSVLLLGFVVMPIVGFSDTYNYDSQGRLDSIRHDDGTTTWFNYDSQGRVSSSRRS